MKKAYALYLKDRQGIELKIVDWGHHPAMDKRYKIEEGIYNWNRNVVISEDKALLRAYGKKKKEQWIDVKG